MLLLIRRMRVLLKKNEKVLREISEECDLTEEQKNEIDNTIELWRLRF